MAFIIGTGIHNLTPAIVVIDLRSGKYRLWQGGLRRPAKGFDLGIWDLSWSGARTLDFVESWCVNEEWLYCGYDTAQVRALSVGAGGGSLAGSTLVWATRLVST